MINKESRMIRRRSENKNYEPIYGSDIFNQLPMKCNKRNKKNENPKYNNFSYKKYKKEENIYPFNKDNYPTKNYNKKESDENIFNPFRTTYNSFYKKIHLNENNIVGINKDLGTGVAYNSRKQKIDFLKSNIFAMKANIIKIKIWKIILIPN